MPSGRKKIIKALVSIKTFGPKKIYKMIIKLCAMRIQELVDWGPSSSDFALLRALERGGCLMRKTGTSTSLIVITSETLFFPFKSILSSSLII